MRAHTITRDRYYFRPGELEKKLGIKGTIECLKHHAGNMNWVLIMEQEGDDESNDEN